MQDDVVDKCIIYLNMVTVKLLARIAALNHSQHLKERIRDDVDRFTRAKHHAEAAISFLQQTHFAPDEISLELPWDLDEEKRQEED